MTWLSSAEPELRCRVARNSAGRELYLPVSETGQMGNDRAGLGNARLFQRA